MIARLSQLSVLRAIDAAMAPDSSLEHIGSPPPSTQWPCVVNYCWSGRACLRVSSPRDVALLELKVCRCI